MSKYLNALLLSLGHNSSAVYTDGKKVIGYEQERIDRIKSSSASPIEAIKQIQRFQSIPKETPVFMTHWFDTFGTFKPNKYSAGIYDYVQAFGGKIYTHSPSFTHHDAHAYSALSFFKHYYKFRSTELAENQDLFFIVADGFGNFKEVLTVYKMNKQDINKLEVIHKAYGYEKSLGLMYQYATHFCGMKMNQDEYKFLGYESRLKDFFTTEQCNQIFIRSREKVKELSAALLLEESQQTYHGINDIINFGALSKVKDDWQKIFKDLCTEFKIDDYNSNNARVLIAHYVQCVVEFTMSEIISRFRMNNICVAGGLFYNVKLNNHILKQINGIFSVVPLAGDQGAGIGFYERYVANFDWSTLAIGKRDMSKAMTDDIMASVQNVYVPETEEECVDIMYKKIIGGEIVNLVTDTMEFGPRALGHTSSLFYPVQRLSDINNQLNQRNEVMPFAPLVLNINLESNFNKHQFKRVIGSDRFMIVTYDYLEQPDDSNRGVYHKYPEVQSFPGKIDWSGRPQVIHSNSNQLLHELMVKLYSNQDQELLTNTSYNYHGEPIVYSMVDVTRTHYKQLKNAEKLGVEVNLVLFNQSRGDNR